MNTVQVAQHVLENGASMIRPKKDGIGYDIKPIFTGSKKGWIMIDSYSAGAINAVFNAINDVNKRKFEALSINKALTISFRMIK